MHVLLNSFFRHSSGATTCFSSSPRTRYQGSSKTTVSFRVHLTPFPGAIYLIQSNISMVALVSKFGDHKVRHFISFFLRWSSRYQRIWIKENRTTNSATVQPLSLPLIHWTSVIFQLLPVLWSTHLQLVWNILEQRC